MTHKKRQRYEFSPLRPNAPIRTLKEVGKLLNLGPDQVKFIENTAIRKIRAALAAYGYNKETQ